MASSGYQRVYQPFLFLIVLPVFILFIADRAIGSYSSYWQSVAAEVPVQIFDPYRVEGILRSSSRGRHNVFILGDSTTVASVDTDILDDTFSVPQRKFQILSVGGAATATFGFMANRLSDFDPSVVIIFASAYTLRSRNYDAQVYSYDVRVLPELFTRSEIFANPSFHLSGLIDQAHILIRHRHAMQRMALIQLGIDSWGRIAREGLKRKIAFVKNRVESPLMIWVRDRKPETFPNPNSRSLEYLAKYFGERGTRLIVVESSIHPIFGLLLQQEKLVAFRNEVSNSMARHGMTFIPNTAMPAMAEADFDDHSHLSAQGKSKFTRALIPHIRSALTQSVKTNG